MPVFLYMFRDTIFVINIFIRVLQLTTDKIQLTDSGLDSQWWDN